MDNNGSWLTDRLVEAERETGTSFDLSACVREPIHRLGGIQSYGALVALRHDTVAVISENASALLGPGVAVGDPVLGWLSAEQLTALRALADADTGQTAMMPVPLNGRWFDVTVHRSEGLLVLEFEPAAPVTTPFTMFYAPIRSALVRLQAAATVVEAAQAAVREVRAITGFDRVVAYRFESVDGPGEVIAEETAEGQEPWLGLWFPATDIPPQARRLYEQNWIRVIADVDDATVRLVPPVLASGEPLDLSLSVLRTVSPFHLEYLRNIGVASSMSVSLLVGGRLWGLIACHGHTPKALGPQLRAACEFFGAALSLHLTALRERDDTGARERSRTVIARLIEPIADSMASGWSDPAGLDRVVESDAVVVRLNGDTTVHGADPGTEALDALWAALPPSPAGTPWHSDRLGEDLPAMAPFTGAIDGALVLPLSDAGDQVVWLRRERTAPRRWAADPARPVVLGPHGERLTPRGSTAVFLATVRGRSAPWSTTDLAMAVELGRAILQVALAHTHRLSSLSTELSRSSVDLDSFAHAAAHDLKEPLRGISNQAAFLAEDNADGMDEVTAHRLASIQRLASRMDELLNALLYYSRLGRTDLHREEIDLNTAVTRALEIAGPRLEEESVRVTVTPSHGLLADPVLFDELLVNLLVNAAKYARPDGPRHVEVATAEIDGEPALMVRDNGIGIPAHLRGQAFELFRRLHPRGTGGDGSGAGLAIVRRIAERHGGRAWADESPGGGTTIWVTFSR
ncbi:light-regulated signal transduction histidine kinase (bacteriophytochrome) [Catenuloplanes nepalensis]|uniref:Sensor-like histidine kinase SenX3 n=1 Tax=Catenuloplanes nepalensis TaxID=587533 RepID=A0ABT9N502_9ACTN|nr:ATP-binding protein [Catenuloplanes nepalensis]MDP9798773.1 light-regulated signal transduction histidine kinase (bacteriophytochrome) [Catenuloplanes nepalensis]